MDLKNFYNISFVMNDLSQGIVRKIQDYENNIKGNFVIKKDFYNIEFIYMHSVILDMAKLISVTKVDKSGLNQLEKISPKEIKQQIKYFNEKYKKIIVKITQNRNRIISHLDISNKSTFFNMGFSNLEIENKIADFKKYVLTYDNKNKESIEVFVERLEQLKSKSIENERYSPCDFIEDIPTLKDMITKISKILREVDFYYYNQST